MASLTALSKNEWHEHRARHVGASEIASLFYEWLDVEGRVRYLHMFEEAPDGWTMRGCISRHTTGFRLYQIKTGKIDPDNLDEVERVQAGTHLEPALAAWAVQKWPDFAIRKVRRYIVHPTVPGMGQSRDYEEVIAGVGGFAGYPPVEFKNVDYLIFRDQWQAEGEGIVTPPIDITLQVQAQMAGTKAPYGWIVVCVGGNKLYRTKIMRHEPTIARIEAATAAFWQAIAEGKAPFSHADFDTVAELLAEGTKGLETVLRDDNEGPELCGRYLALKESIKALEAEAETVKSALALKIGEGTAAVFQGYRITWPSIHREAKTISYDVDEKVYRGAFTVRAKP
jgi:hypothetical protein